MELNKITARAIEVRKELDLYNAAKHGSPWTKVQIMQGLVGDIGDLMKLIMVKEGARTIDDVDKKLAHELADCLWCILVLANKFNIDIEQAFLNTMDTIEERIK